MWSIPKGQDRATKVFEIRPDHVLPAVEEDLATLKSGFATLEKELANPQTGETWGKRRIEYDYSSVIEKMEVLGRPLDYRCVDQAVSCDIPSAEGRLPHQLTEF